MLIKHANRLVMVATAAALIAGESGFAAERAELDRAAEFAVMGDRAQRTEGLVELRLAGPEGLKVLIQHFAGRSPATGAAQSSLPATGTSQFERRLATALDYVAQQRGAKTSQLYWYTDLEAAKAAARQLNRPILSLRLLGNLTDEYSCANSRFFRTVLYTNREIAELLRNEVVLHWSSERPVPIVTIDFGDGRKLKRTLTGNSAHYVLDSSGRPVDVLPGLYGPQAFKRTLSDALTIANRISGLDNAEANRLVKAFHRDRLQATLDHWAGDLAKVRGQDARQIELAANLATLDRSTMEQDWNKLAALHAVECRLDDASRAQVRLERPAAPGAMARTVSKAMVEDPLLRVVLDLEQNLALDTVRNEYRLHSVAHAWYASSQVTFDLAQLNNRVYAELFLTPASDPWMGLAPAVYTGLEGSGMQMAESARRNPPAAASMIKSSYPGAAYNFPQGTAQSSSRAAR